VVEGWGLGGMGNHISLLAFRLHISVITEGKISGGFCDRICSINFCPPNSTISRRFQASGSGKEFCIALVSLGLCMGLLSLSHSSSSSWDSSCVGVLTGHTGPSSPSSLLLLLVSQKPHLVQSAGQRWSLAKRA